MNIKPPAITLHPRGLIHLSASVRETLGDRVLFYIENNRIIVKPVKHGGFMAYDNGCCCFAPLTRALKLKTKMRIPLIEKMDRWEGKLA